MWIIGESSESLIEVSFAFEFLSHSFFSLFANHSSAHSSVRTRGGTILSHIVSRKAFTYWRRDAWMNWCYWFCVFIENIRRTLVPTVHAILQIIFRCYRRVVILKVIYIQLVKCRNVNFRDLNISTKPWMESFCLNKTLAKSKISRKRFYKLLNSYHVNRINWNRWTRFWACRMILWFLFNPNMFFRISCRQPFFGVFLQKPCDEIHTICRHRVKGFVVVVIFSYCHVSHSFYITFSSKWWQARHTDIKQL